MTNLRVDVGLVVHRLSWGGSLVKLNRLDETPEAANPPGGHQGATGIRYLTLAVPDLDALVARCEGAGYSVTVPRTEEPARAGQGRAGDRCLVSGAEARR